MLVEEFCDMDMKNYVVGNYQFVNLEEVSLSPVHSGNTTIDQICKYTSVLSLVTSGQKFLSLLTETENIKIIIY